MRVTDKNSREKEMWGLASTLTRAMKRLKVTQPELAERAGVTQSYISQICSGKKIPTIGTLRRICDALGIPTSELICTDEVGHKMEGETALSEEEQYLLRCYRSMSQKDKTVVFGLVDRLHQDVRQDIK